MSAIPIADGLFTWPDDQPRLIGSRCISCGDTGLMLQLRGDAGPRQVPNDPRTGFTHSYGAPGISACTVLIR